MSDGKLVNYDSRKAVMGKIMEMFTDHSKDIASQFFLLLLFIYSHVHPLFG
jgi:hypothetical protein